MHHLLLHFFSFITHFSFCFFCRSPAPWALPRRSAVAEAFEARLRR
jgi:hypothetical protein